MPVHVFGHPCDIGRIASIAKKHKLKVIYDGAHAFGVKYDGRSLLNYGDISTCSFHATKLFHTIEGGAVIAKDKIISDKVELTKRFGHNADDHLRLGINAKASESHAAMGLCNLKYIDSIIAERKKITKLYDKLLSNKFKKPTQMKSAEHNYAYYPVVFGSESRLMQAIAKLNEKHIFPRRYFYPSLNRLSYVNGESCPISEDISSRIACLPLYVGLKNEVIEKIARSLNEI